MTRDSLRATLDNLQVDPESAQDRPYLEAMLRRLGYTEKEIRAELGPPLEADERPAPDLEREYRLVTPARESAFLLDNAGRNDAPLEGRVQFEVVDDDGLPDESLEFQTLEESAEPALEENPEEHVFEPVEEEAPAQAESFPVEEDTEMSDEDIATFGDNEVEPAPKTRVRVKRVRARSRADAESQVATGDRRVIKSVPVDIVERWGDEEEGR